MLNSRIDILLGTLQLTLNLLFARVLADVKKKKKKMRPECETFSSMLSPHTHLAKMSLLKSIVDFCREENRCVLPASYGL